MNNFKKNDRFGGKPSFGGRGGKPSFGGGRPSFGGRGGSSGGDRTDRQMHEATCADCGKRTEVPFRPTGDKPVYCRDCFRKPENAPGGGSSPRRDDRGPRPEFRSSPSPSHAPQDPRIEDLKRQIDSVHSKLDQVIRMIKPLAPAAVAEVDRPSSPQVAPESPKAKSQTSKPSKKTGKKKPGKRK